MECFLKTVLDPKIKSLQSTLCLISQRYFTSSVSPRVLLGKLSLLCRGKAFFKEQLYYANREFTETTTTDASTTGLEVTGDEEYEFPDEDNDDYDEDDDFEENTSSCSDEPIFPAEIDEMVNARENDNTLPLSYQCMGTVTRWNFPAHLSQSTIDGRNGSAACSVISLVLAHNIQQLTITPSADPEIASQTWYRLMTRSIRIGNFLYNSCRDALPQRDLSAAEAVDVVEMYTEIAITSPKPVRVCDSHEPSTLNYQLLFLLSSLEHQCAVFIIDERAVVFATVSVDTIAFFDSHVHGKKKQEQLSVYIDSL